MDGNCVCACLVFPTHFFISRPLPFHKQTLARIVECLDGNTIVGVREEPRLTEQVGR